MPEGKFIKVKTAECTQLLNRKEIIVKLSYRWLLMKLLLNTDQF